ncbi:restriction endonuclease subunit S [Helicobacter pylori]
MLVNKIANAGTAYFMPKLNQPVSLGMNLFLLRIKPNYNNFFIFKQIANYERVLKTFANGSATKTITKNVIKNLLIPLPPLNEQIAIANILSDLDRYLYALDALILKKESVKKALSFELLSQRKRLKGFNQAWQRVRLGDIAEIKRGVRITKNELDVFGKYPVVSGGVGFLGYTNNFNRYENTITIAQYGTAGYVNFQKNKFWANDVCFCVYPNKDVIKNIFLYYFLKVNQNYLYEISNRNATPYSISKDKILDFEILLPPLNEQIAIANILSGLDSEIISLKNKKRQFENIKKALNHDLMSAKIRVLKK